MFGGYLELLTLTLSYPLRLMATGLSAAVLRLFGYAATAERTMLEVRGMGDLAITDACGGIEQLPGLIVVGAVFAWLMQRRLGWRLFHFGMILPSVVLANTIRLVVTVVLLGRFGDVILMDTWHRGLGWFQTVLAVGLVWLSGRAIRSAT